MWAQKSLLTGYVNTKGKKMSKTKHTLGKWEAEKMLIPYTEKDHRCGIVINSTKTVGEFPTRICDMRCDQEKGFVEMRANAALIAAAPELLEALESAKHLLELLDADTNLLSSQFAEETAGEITDAIAKAKGEN